MKIKQKFLYRTLYTCLVFSAGFLCAAYRENIVSQMELLTHKPTVTVLMSTYNRAHALPIAIESILNQTYDDFEFIIVNDGSEDDTDKQIDFYAQKDSRIIHLTNKQNKGLIYSLNRGLDIARGKYIVRMDDDDKSVPFRLERQVRAMEAYPHITVLGASIIGKDTTPIEKQGMPRLNNPDEIELNTYFSSGLAHPTIIIRRDFLEKHKIRYDKDYLYAEDCGLYKDILNKGGQITSMNEGLLHFGYTKDVTHPEKYSYIQGETFKKIQKEKLEPFFDAPYDMLGAFKSIENKCEILKKMVPVNKEKKILNQFVLEKMQSTVCAKALDMKNAVKITHPYWTDHIIVNPDNTFLRVDIREETGKFEKKDNNTVIVKWDKWPSEIYQIENDKHWIYLKDENGTVKSPKK